MYVLLKRIEALFSVEENKGYFFFFINWRCVVLALATGLKTNMRIYIYLPL